MSQPNCYMPTWDANKKLSKKGSYCNWESVLAHARSEYVKACNSETYNSAVQVEALEHFTAICDHVFHICGTTVIEAPSYKTLTHMGGLDDMLEFQQKCAVQSMPVTILKIQVDGEAIEILTRSVREEIEYKLGKYEHRAQICKFNPLRKRANNNKELCVFHNADEVEVNHTASNIFKQQLFGDVYLVQQSKEHCWTQRERMISYTHKEFEDELLKKRKARCNDVPHMTPTDFMKARQEMQVAFDQIEANMSKDALKPQELSKVMRMPLAKRCASTTSKEDTADPPQQTPTLDAVPDAVPRAVSLNGKKRKRQPLALKSTSSREQPSPTVPSPAAVAVH